MRCLVVSFGMVVPDLQVPMVVVHCVNNKAELTLANTGSPRLYDMLKARAEAPDGVEYYTNLVVSTIANAPQFEDQVECALVKIDYKSVQDLVDGRETATYSARALHPVDARCLDFCSC